MKKHNLLFCIVSHSEYVNRNDLLMLLQWFSLLCSAAVRQKGDGRGVWRADAEVSHSKGLDGRCECFTRDGQTCEWFAAEQIFTNSFHSSFVDIGEVRRAHGEDSQSVQEKQKRVGEEAGCSLMS